MSQEKNVVLRAQRRALRVRSAIKRNSQLPRVSVFRSLNHMYAQLIDDAVGKTLASCSSIELTTATGNKKEIAHTVGRELAKRAQQVGVTQAVLDRGPFLYHGRVKSLADGLREGGLKI